MVTVRDRARDHVPGLTLLLTTVSLALVFGAVLGVIPARLLPRAPDGVLAAIPTINAGISTLALFTIGGGWLSIRRGAVDRHRALMGTSAALFAAFLLLYLYRMILEGTTAFGGPEVVYRFVYLPVLGVHMLLAIVCVPLVYYVLLLAGTRSVSEVPRTNHARVGRVAATLWLISFALGDVVFLLLYVVY